MHEYDAKQVIKSYLDERAKTDELFANIYSNPAKNFDECYDYILGEIMAMGNAVGLADSKVYGMAVHYYSENEIQIKKLPHNCEAVIKSTVELTEEDKNEARQEAIRRLADEQHAILKKKPSKVKNEVTEAKQMSLF